jgi:hypothetical protein
MGISPRRHAAGESAVVNAITARALVFAYGAFRNGTGAHVLSRRGISTVVILTGDHGINPLPELSNAERSA